MADLFNMPNKKQTKNYIIAHNEFTSIHTNKKQIEVSWSQSRKIFETKEIKGDNRDQTVTDSH